MKTLIVSDYARLIGQEASTIRKKIKSGKIPHTTIMVNNRQVLAVLVDDNFEGVADIAEGVRAKNEDFPEDFRATEKDLAEEIPEAELINNNESFSLIKIEKDSFDSLINNIKALSDDRAATYEQNYTNLQNEYFELKAENKKLMQEKLKDLEEKKEEILREKIKLVQIESEKKILELRVQELEKKISDLDAKQNKKPPEALPPEAKEHTNNWFSKL